MVVTEHGNGEKVVWVNLIKTDAAEMKYLLDVMNEEFDMVEMAIKSTKPFEAGKIFPIMNNNWSLQGSIEAFGRSRQPFKRTVKDRFLYLQA